MKALFLRKYVWYEKRYLAGEVHDLDKSVYDYLLAEDVIKPAKTVVEQPEARSAFKPVATMIEPLPPEAAKSLGVKVPRKHKK